MKDVTLNGRPAMSEARHQHVHGPLQRETTLSKVQSIIDNRPEDEPHPLFGAIIFAGLTGILIVTATLFYIATGGAL